MGMVTNCPGCRARFRVTTEQLQTYADSHPLHGLVRCGLCSRVFNAFDALVPSGAESLAASPPVKPKPVETSATPVTSPGLTQASPDPSDNGVQIAPVIAADAMPLKDTDAPKPRSLIWTLSSVALLGILFTQGLYYFRDTIAARSPRIVPFMRNLCELLRCEVGLPKNPDLLSIESSDLQADPRRPSLVSLSAILRNRSPYAMAFPMLELSLTDSSNALVARRVLNPSEYISEKQNVVQGMPGGGEVAVQLNFDLGGLKSSGYRLYVFYTR
ncbi:MAG: zinc-ribbon and DUF3426 domain-containing protein [Burkholderiales bacterium]